MVDAVVAAAEPTPEVGEPAAAPAPKPRRSRAKKQQPELAVAVEMPDAPVVEAPAAPEPIAVPAGNGDEPVAAAKPRRTRKPKAEQPAPSRSMPEAIGHAPKRRTPKPKEVTE